MLRLYLENEIIELSNNLETIWVSVLDKYEKLFEYLSNEERVELIKEDLIINESVLNIDKKGYDLRRIISVIKISTDIERIGDRIVEILKNLQILQNNEILKKIISEIKILHEVIGLHMNRAISCYREEQSGCLDMVVIQKQNEIEELSINMEKKIMNYIFEDDGNVSEVISALDIIHHLDKIAHTTQAIYKWIMYRKYGNIN
ncbi:TPA: phosphate uptake regulator PhoU [Streptococcus pneumoniae]|nr:phosphate uptake regulator PhoU [Streptococcus pneumoniae]